MRRMLGLIGAVALFAVGSASTVAAQASIWLGGGATIPMGEYKDFGDGDGAKTGWMGAAGVNVSVGDQGLFVGANFMYGQNKHETPGHATNLIGYNGHVGYRFGDPERTGVYLYGMAGMLNHQFDDGSSKDNDSKFGWGAGGGVDVPVANSVAVWVGSGYYNRSGTAFLSLMAGLSIAVGGGN